MINKKKDNYNEKERRRKLQKDRNSKRKERISHLYIKGKWKVKKKQNNLLSIGGGKVVPSEIISSFQSISFFFCLIHNPKFPIIVLFEKYFYILSNRFGMNVCLRVHEIDSCML